MWAGSQIGHYGAPIRRRISHAGCHRAECGSAVPIQMPYVIQQEGDSRRDTNTGTFIRTFSSAEPSFLNQEPFEVRAILNPRGYARRKRGWERRTIKK
jgi:hypothetical protein